MAHGGRRKASSASSRRTKQVRKLFHNSIYVSTQISSMQLGVPRLWVHRVMRESRFQISYKLEDIQNINDADKNKG